LVLCEAAWHEPFWRELLAAFSEKRKLTGQPGMLAGTQTLAFSELWDDSTLETTVSVHGGEQSNTSAVFDERLILKLFRRVTPGVNPDFEIGRELTEHAQLPHVPKVAGQLEYRDESGRQMTVAILHEYIPNVGDAWTYTLDELGRYFERVQSLEVSGFRVPGSGTEKEQQAIDIVLPASLKDLMELSPPPLARDTVGGYLHSAELLGRRTAELHVALVTTAGGLAFSPEPFTQLYLRGLYQSMRSQARATLEFLRARIGRLDEESQQQAKCVLDHEQSIFARFGELLHDRIDARRIRCHGDYHLGQVLFTGKDFVIIDFEGEPERPVSERRIKASPLRDVAGMLRSFHYVAHAALRGKTPTLFVGNVAISNETWAAFWYTWTSATFLQSYFANAEPGSFLPSGSTHRRTLLGAYLLEKALYELRYELNNRPDWVKIPLEGILQLVN
jgi:maltose alpha-D-glucosyltransferase/alpha-amylase